MTTRPSSPEKTKALSENGAPAISKFTNRLAATDGAASVALIHAAAAPAVDVKAKGPNGAKLKLRDLANGDQSFAVPVPPGTYEAVVRGANGEGTVFGPGELATLDAGVAYTVIAVGSLDAGTFQVLFQAID